ncbi:MAG: NUDIX domain-containing protein [Proteobacteria bacterium]|nr:NUDIX domain-containing protein [Pseudomonadota bacterium]
MPDAPVPPKLSATVLLLRNDAAGALEVFMVQRHHQIDFAKGAMVFPGGKVDPGDAEALEFCSPAEGLSDEAQTLRVAAVRETFEECGVLLARPRGERELVSAERLRELEAAYRVPLQSGDVSVAAVAEREKLELAIEALVPFAHWITPEFMRKRFDTHFFLIEAPPHQLAVHDGAESIDSVWIPPLGAVAEQEAGRRTIVFPTLMNLRKLGRAESVAAALDNARREPVVTVLPTVTKGDDGQPVLELPPEAGYPDATESLGNMP